MWISFEQRWFSVYEQLRRAGYRLIGQEYKIHHGLPSAHLTDGVTHGQRLFGLLFPLVSILVAAVALGAVWLYTYVRFLPDVAPQAYYLSAPLWHMGLQFLAVILLLFAAPAYFDVHRALRLLQKSTDQPPEQTNKEGYEGKDPQ